MTLSTLPALGFRLSLLPVPDPNPDHDEDDNHYDRQNYADRGTARDRGIAPEGVMVGEGWGGGRRHQGSGDPFQCGHGKVKCVWLTAVDQRNDCNNRGVAGSTPGRRQRTSGPSPPSFFGRSPASMRLTKTHTAARTASPRPRPARAKRSPIIVVLVIQPWGKQLHNKKSNEKTRESYQEDNTPDHPRHDC